MPALQIPKSKSDNYTEMLPHWEISERKMFLQPGGAEAGFALHPTSSSFLSDAALERLLDHAKLLLHILPVGVRLRASVESRAALALPKSVKDHFDTPLTHPGLARRREHARRSMMRTLDRGLLRQYHYTLSVHLPGPALKPGSKHTPATQEVLGDRLEELCNLLESSLRAAGLGPKRLDDQNLFACLWRHYNPDLADSVPEFEPYESRFYLGMTSQKADPSIQSPSLRRQALATEVDASLLRSLVVGDRHLTTVSVQSIPRRSTPDYLRNLTLELLNLECDFAITVDFCREASEPIKRSLETAVRSLGTETRGPQNTTRLDVTAGAKEKKLEGVLSYLETSNDGLFQSGFGVVISSASHTGLMRARSGVLGALARLGAKHLHAGSAENFKQWAGHLAPLSGQQNLHKFRAVERDAADWIPVSGPWEGCAKATSTFETRWGVPVGVDLFDPRLYNYNAAVVGGSGSGKSVLCQGLVLDSLSAGHEVVVIDKGFSYLTLADLLDGGTAVQGRSVNVVSFEPGKSSVNIFELPPGQFEATPEKIAGVVEFLEALLPRVDGDRLATRRSILYEAVSQTYAFNTRDEFDHATSTQRRVLNPFTLSAFVERLHKLSAFRGIDADSSIKTYARELAVQMQPMCGNTQLGKLLDRPSNVNLTGEFLYLEYSALDRYKELTDVVVLLLNELVWQRVLRRPGSTTRAMFDECFALLERPEAAAVVVRSFREGRKHGLGSTAITQAVSELARVPGLLGSTSSFFLGASVADADLLAPHGFSKRTLEEAASLGRNLPYGREFLLGMKFGGEEGGELSGEVLRFRPDPFTYWATTTHKGDKSLRAEATEKQGVTFGLEALARDLPPAGSM